MRSMKTSEADDYGTYEDHEFCPVVEETLHEYDDSPEELCKGVSKRRATNDAKMGIHHVYCERLAHVQPLHRVIRWELENRVCDVEPEAQISVSISRVDRVSDGDHFARIDSD